MKKLLSICLILLTSTFRLFSAEYMLKIQPEQWEIKPKGYFIREIRDERIDKSLGKVMVNGIVSNVNFPSVITNDLFQLVNKSVSFDTLSIPVILEIEKFNFSVKGNAAKHQDILDFSIRFIREIEGEKFELFKLSGKPQMNVQGNMPEVAEKNVLVAMKQSFLNFDSWIKENMNIPTMVTAVDVQFVPNEKLKSNSGDTLIWGEDYKLVWDDFKGPVPTSDFAAESNCMFNYTARPEIANGIMTLYVTFNACFIKGSSWVKENKNQDSLLLHEQYHFNICEVHVRRLKTKIKSLQLNPMKIEQQVKVVFDEEWKAYMQAQSDYDDETQHGIVTEKQNQWIRDVDYWLSE